MRVTKILYVVWCAVLVIGAISIIVMICGARSSKDSVKSRRKYVIATLIGMVTTMVAFPFSITIGFVY